MKPFSHTLNYLFYYRFILLYSEFQLDASYARKNEKTVVVSTWGAEHDGTIIKIAFFFKMFPT